MSQSRRVSLRKLAELIGLDAASVAALPDVQVTGLAEPESSGADRLVVITGEKYARRLLDGKAAAVVAGTSMKLPPSLPMPVVLVPDPEMAAVELLEYFAEPIPRPPEGLAPTAVVDPTATLGPGCRIGPNVVIGAAAKLGAGCVLHANAVVGEATTLGEGCELFSGVVLYPRITLGNRVVVHANASIGADGFGYKWDGKKHRKVPQIGTVVIEDDVEIGANTCVDRAKFGVTKIGRGTKIDNLVQVGHNCRTGQHCIICGQTGLAGTVTMGNGVVLGGQVAVNGHTTLNDGVTAAARSAIVNDVAAGITVSGVPAMPHRQSLREQAAFRRTPDLVVQVRKLEEELDRLKKKLQDA
ncbi:MAG: UDP-3-O-(3-hydroxymyristoyl)glucosamine N-acyltransferase [Phycisphaerae bacterium]